MHQTAGRAWEAVERARGLLALRDSDKRKEEFLAMLAHELRNPLAPIGTAAQLRQLIKLGDCGERVRQTSDVIERQVSHMTSLIDDLLDVSRVTRGLVRLDKVPLDSRLIITDVLKQAGSVLRYGEAIQNPAAGTSLRMLVADDIQVAPRA